MRKVVTIILLTLVFLISGCSFQTQNNSSEMAKDGNNELKVSMLDVGQGDAILIQTKTQTILVDTSDTDERELLVNELEKFSVTKIDKLILTHPHADHIGNAKILINANKKDISNYPYLEKVSVSEVYDNGIISASPLYNSYLKAIESAKTIHKSLKAGDVLDFGGDVKFFVLFPTAGLVREVNDGLKSDPNNESVVGRLSYKNFSMMFMGDAENKVEDELLKTNAENLTSDVLKAGHHGSYTASTKNFVSAINPVYVLISAGAEEKRRNTYGHPHLEALENYLAVGVDKKNILCTRWNGTITITSNGENFSVKPERKENWLDEWIMQKKRTSKK